MDVLRQGLETTGSSKRDEVGLNVCIYLCFALMTLVLHKSSGGNLSHIKTYLYEPYASNINSGKNKFSITAASVSLVMLSTAIVICAFSSSTCQGILLTDNK